LGVGLEPYQKKKIVEKPPRNSAGFCGGGQGLSWAVEPRKERRTLEWTLKKQDMRVWTGFVWLRTGTSGGLF
jgi:hypothetical protein